MSHKHFAQLVDFLQQQLLPGEQFTLDYRGEVSDFVRFNQGRVRQAGQVRQSEVGLRLIHGQRHAEYRLGLSGQGESDRRRLGVVLGELRGLLPQLAPDPHLRLWVESWHSHEEQLLPLPEVADAVRLIETLGAGLDLVGIYAAGPQYRGFASSWGARGWYAASSFHFDWSLFHANGQAIKSSYAGADWQPDALSRCMTDAKQQLAHLGQPAVKLPPGAYRAYLAPAALESVVQMLQGNGFSAQALATGSSPLQRLYGGGQRLSPLFSLEEGLAGGLAPSFTGEGPRRPLRLVDAGLPKERLVSSRSAAEFGLVANGAGSEETPLALALAPGNLTAGEILQRLDKGLYISNLWYLNFSDRPAARLTGMTRFACFWVENGAIQAPLPAMRFDDSPFGFLGEHLEALTDTPELRLPAVSYGSRRLGSLSLPGALTSRFTLTL